VVEASAPASAANLGPGFDTVALALEMRCTVSASRSGTWSVAQVGRYRAPDGDLVVEAARTAVGDQPLAITVRSDIPVGRGLGSSSAVIAASAAAAWRSVGHDPTPEEVFELTASLEGHPDNAAAAVYGGLVSVGADGSVRSLELARSLHVVLAIPLQSLPTEEARKILPEQVPRAVAVRSLQRLAALLEGLRTGSAAAFQAALGDELHEGPRAGLSPMSGDLITGALDAGAHYACWSGAGPSVVAITDGEHAGAVVERLRHITGSGGDVVEPAIAWTGLDWPACEASPDSAS